MWTSEHLPVVSRGPFGPQLQIPLSAGFGIYGLYGNTTTPDIEVPPLVVHVFPFLARVVYVVNKADIAKTLPKKPKLKCL